MNKDVLAGILFVLFGSVWLYAGSSYPLGSAFRMGPGYFPIVLSIGLILVGVIMIGKAYRSRADFRLLGWKQAIAVLLGVTAFAGVERLGMVISALLVVLISATAKTNWRPLEIAVFSAAITVFSVVVFKTFLGMTVPVWPAF